MSEWRKLDATAVTRLGAVEARERCGACHGQPAKHRHRHAVQVQVLPRSLFR